MRDNITCQFGFAESMRGDAARLYDEAFGKKFSLAIPNRQKRIILLTESLAPEFAAAAFAGEKLAGLAGFQTRAGALTGGITAQTCFRFLGFWGGLRALFVFALYERRPQNSELLMDGIAVKKEIRGQGAGTKLINALIQYARENGFAQIRLDVIDSNPAARRLYERLGFAEVKTHRFPFLRRFLGFGAATEMRFYIK